MRPSPDHWWHCTRCNGWEWQRKHECRQCKQRAPPWIFKLPNKHPKPQADQEGFVPVPGGRKAGKRARQLAAKLAKAGEAARESTDAETHPKPQETEDKRNKQQLVDKIRKMEESRKLLDKHEPTQVLAGLDDALADARAELREAAPTARRLQSLQQGVDRKEDRLAKLQQKREELLKQQSSLEPQLYAEIETLRASYTARHKSFESQLEDLQQQTEALGEALQELREQQRSLVPVNAAEETKPGVGIPEMEAFAKVLQALDSNMPQYGQVFHEMRAVAAESMPGIAGFLTKENKLPSAPFAQESSGSRVMGYTRRCHGGRYSAACTNTSRGGHFRRLAGSAGCSSWRGSALPTSPLANGRSPLSIALRGRRQR
eukprot:5116576-Amphidinium_carterae.2